MDREERAAICNGTGNTSPNNSALRLATAFSKGIDEFLEKPLSRFAGLLFPGMLVQFDSRRSEEDSLVMDFVTRKKRMFN